jgi:hypothetical protein
MARIELSGIQLPLLSKINIDGQLTLTSSAGTSGQVLTSQGAGTTPIWTTVSGGGSGFTGAGTSITNITGAANNNMTILGAVSTTGGGQGNLILKSKGTGNVLLSADTGGKVNIGGEYSTSRPSGSISIVGQSGANSGGNIYIQSAYATGDGPGNIYIDGQYDEVDSRGSIYIAAGVDGALSASSAVYLGANGIPLFIDGYIANPLKVSGNSAGTSGQFLKSNGTGGPPTWTTLSGYNGNYVLIQQISTSGSGFGSAPAFSSIPQTYKKIVVTIVFSTSASGLTGTFGLTTNSGNSSPHTRYAINTSSGAVTATANAGLNGVIVDTTIPTLGVVYTWEFPNYTGPNPTILGYGKNIYSFGTTANAITQVSFTGGTSNNWGNVYGIASIYGVN